MYALLNKKIAAIILSISFLLMGSSVLLTSTASSPSPSPVLPSQCLTVVATGWQPTPIINIKMTVMNDEDTGFAGYWAIDNYIKTVIVWRDQSTTPTTFCAIEQYSGTWTTFSGGALSPQNGVSEPASGSGPLAGAIVFTFTGTFLGSGSAKPPTGSIGTFNYGGTAANVKLGTYALQGNPLTGYVDVFSFYFTPTSTYASANDLAWSWIYTNGDGVGYGNMWVNSASGSYGDIITSTPTSTPTPVMPSECLTTVSTGWSTSPIVNSVMAVVADEDAGNVGYWALDNYLHGMIIWENPTTTPYPTFCALVQYQGSWTTFTYAASPENQASEPSGGSGPLVAGYVATFDGTYAPMFKSTGFIGTFNDGGTKSDILTPVASQKGDLTYVSFLRLYFTDPYPTPIDYTFNWLAVSYIYTHGYAGYGSLFVSSPLPGYNIGDIVT